MVLSTTETIAGKEIKEVLGIARGSTVRTRNAGRDIIAMLKNIVGGVPIYVLSVLFHQ